MTTGLWGVTSGLAAATLAAAVPPSCRRAITAASASDAGRAGADVLVESPAWPVAGATHFVPAFAALDTAPYSLRLEMSVRAGGAWTPWVAGVTLGPATFAPGEPSDVLAVDIDVFSAAAPVEAARLRVRLPASESPAVLAAPWMLTLSAGDRAIDRSPPDDRHHGAAITVPPHSQMDAGAALARRVCSPTCVAMLLDFWRRPPALGALAAEMLHPGLDLYGVWPAAIKAAARRGLAGYLLRFPGWAAAQWCLAQGLPVIASIRYAAGELTGAAAPETPGHLIVLTGWDGDDVLVNDPAAATAGQAPRRYRRDDLQRVWLERTGVGFVMFPPDAALRGG